MRKQIKYCDLIPGKLYILVLKLEHCSDQFSINYEIVEEWTNKPIILIENINVNTLRFLKGIKTNNLSKDLYWFYEI